MSARLSLVPHSGGSQMPAAIEPTDDELVAQAREGSRPAFETLVRRFQRPLYFLCLRYVRDHDAAADLTQRAFIRAMDKIQELREANTFRGWLYRIGANLALNHLRDNARFVAEGHEGQAVAVDDPETAPAAHTLMEAAEDSQTLRRAVALLPTKQRMTLELRVYEDLPFRDIALALDTTEGAAKVNFHYAVRRLRELLARPAASKMGKPGKP